VPACPDVENNNSSRIMEAMRTNSHLIYRGGMRGREGEGGNLEDKKLYRKRQCIYYVTGQHRRRLLQYGYVIKN